VFSGNVWFVPVDGRDTIGRVEDLTDRIQEFDWRLSDVVVSPVRTIEDTPEGLRAE
jgi:hypothetical protein